MLPMFGCLAIILFVIGCLSLLGAFAVMCFDLDDDWVGPLMFFGVVGLVGGVVLGIIVEQSDPEATFTLLKRAWACTQSHTELVTQTVMVGKQATSQVVSQEVCTTYVKLR